MSFKLKTAPATEPVTLAEARIHLRADDDVTDEDALISSLIVSAREYVELLTNCPLITQSWTYYGDCFDGDIELKPNLQTVTTVKYIDTDGTQQTIIATDYDVDVAGVVGSVYPAYNVSWPYARNVKNAIEVEFVAGYGEAVDVPSSIKAAMLLLVGHWYEHRESVIVGVSIAEVPMAVGMLLNPYRVISF